MAGLDPDRGNLIPAEDREDGGRRQEAITAANGAPARCRKCKRDFFVRREHKAYWGRITTGYSCSVCADFPVTRLRLEDEIVRQEAEIARQETEKERYVSEVARFKTAEAEQNARAAEIAKERVEMELRSKFEVARQNAEISMNAKETARIEAEMRIALADKEAAIQSAKLEQEKLKTERERLKESQSNIDLKITVEREKAETERKRIQSETTVAAIRGFTEFWKDGQSVKIQDLITMLQAVHPQSNAQPPKCKPFLQPNVQHVDRAPKNWTAPITTFPYPE